MPSVATIEVEAAINTGQYAPILGLQEISVNTKETQAANEHKYQRFTAMTVQVDPEKAHRSRLGIAYMIAGVLT